MNVGTPEQSWNVLSLCSGGAGLDHGVELAVPTARTVCWVEWEGFAVSELVRRMEAEELGAAPCWTNLRTFDGRPWRGVVDCVIGGYPCQPFSSAGKRKGADDPRHLWPHVARVVEEVRPGVVFFENVSGHVSLGLREVCEHLEAMGYEVAACLFRASDTTASHRRERVFILGVVNGMCGGSGGEESVGRGIGNGVSAHSPRSIERMAHCIGERSECVRGGTRAKKQPQPKTTNCISGCGDAMAGVAVPNAEHAEQRRAGVFAGDGSGTSADGQAEVGQEGSEATGIGRSPVPGERPIVGDGDKPRLEGWGVSVVRGGHRLSAEQTVGEVVGLYPPGPGRWVGADCDDGRIVRLPVDGDAERWCDVLADAPWLAPSLEPGVCLLADGLARDRAARLKLLGNGVVPAQAAMAFITLATVLGVSDK